MYPSRKRGKPQPPVARAKKKHKRLDAIVDKPLPSPPHPLPPDRPSSDDDDRSNQPRRSSRARRVPEVLDSSPIPSNRRKKDDSKNPSPSVDSPTPIEKKVDDLKKKTKKKKKTRSISRSLSFQAEEGNETEGWRSRLRSRASEKGKPKGKAASALAGSGSGRVLKRGNMAKMKSACQDSDLIKVDRDGDVDKISENEEEKFASDSVKEEGEDKVASQKEEEEEEDKVALEKNDEAEVAPDLNELEKRDGYDDENEEEENVASDVEELDTPEQGDEVREDGCNDAMERVETNPEVEKIVAEKHVDADKTDVNADINAVASEKNVKDSDMASPMSDNKLSSSRVKEGRRCGLCGGGTDGKPPKKLVKESVDSDNEAFEGSSASEEPNYDVWDGFGDEPGWLGRLLGPIRDRFGIARVWVHQHCAVWSPEGQGTEV